MITNLARDMNTAILTKALKEDIRTQVEQDSSFVQYSIPYKGYTSGENVIFAGENWEVISDNGSYVTLVLARSLTKSEITSALQIPVTDNAYFDPNSCNETACRIRACRYAAAGVQSCYYYNNSVYSRYSWNPPSRQQRYYGSSIVYKVVEGWLIRNDSLQTAILKNKMVYFTVADGIFNNWSSYIRVPYYYETNSNPVWTHNEDFHTANGSYQNVYMFNGSVYQSVVSITPSLIRPVILVYKG